jgi:predicted  nucleic acid-binding Zn-ribbon protein
MASAIEQLSKIDWWSFLITLAIVITAYVAVKKGLEELSKHISWEPFWLRNERVHRELSEAVVAIKDELVGLKTDVNNIQEEINTVNGNRSHDREDSLNIRDAMYNDLNNTSAQLRQELIDSVRSLGDKIDTMQATTDARFAESEEKSNKRIRAEMKERIAQLYRYYHAKGEVDFMGKETLEDLIEEYEVAGGVNSFVHEVVQKELPTWTVIYPE